MEHGMDHIVEGWVTCLGMGHMFMDPRHIPDGVTFFTTKYAHKNKKNKKVTTCCRCLLRKNTNIEKKATVTSCHHLFASNRKETKTMTLCHSSCLRGVKAKGEVKAMIITNGRCLLSFIGVTNAKNKRHEDDGIEPSSSCLRGVRIGGVEDNNDS